MIEILRILQVLMAISWGVPLVLFAKEAWAKSRNDCDRLRAAMWYASLSVVAFPVRWLVFGGSLQQMPQIELATWAAIYVFGIFAGQFLTWTVKALCDGRS